MVGTELHGLVTQPKPEEFVVFNLPLGQTCVARAGDFIEYYGEYLENYNATDASGRRPLLRPARHGD
ncbi:hypothetical protein BDZ89DRAFT_1133850 [Hymenopellis radicata]|nr:hypothetical protein BDZ89DRAFT_1133850 [Hymenopellis radicata]